MRLPARSSIAALHGVSALPHPRTPLARAAVINAPSVRLPTFALSTFATRAKPSEAHKPGGKTSFPERKIDPDQLQPWSVSWEALGISRNMKLFLMLVLGVFGTIETWFWYKPIWVWWKGKSERNTDDTK